jgi:hypothetical protein
MDLNMMMMMMMMMVQLLGIGSEKYTFLHCDPTADSYYAVDPRPTRELRVTWKICFIKLHYTISKGYSLHLT